MAKKTALMGRAKKGQSYPNKSKRASEKEECAPVKYKPRRKKLSGHVPVITKRREKGM